MKKALKTTALVLGSLFVLLSLADEVVSHSNKFKSLIVGYSGGSFIVRSGATVTMGSPIDLSGTFTESAVDFTNTSINHTGSNGPAWLRGGTYASPVTNSDEDQSGMIRFYGETSADGSSYDRGIFVALKTTGLKDIYPIAGLAEINAQSGNGPNNSQAAQFILHLNSATSAVQSGGFGFFGAWLKVTANAGATVGTGTKMAPVWIDNQLYGNNIHADSEEYAIFATTGGTVPDAFVGFETTSSGWKYLFYFDETMDGVAPISTVTPATQTNDATGSLIMNINGTDYYIPFFTLAQD